MKNFFILLLLLIAKAAYPTVSAGYLFTQVNTTYANVSGGNTLGSTSCDDELFLTNTSGSASSQTAAGFPIGFTFNYNGSNYTQFGVSNNGYIKLGNLATFSMSSNGYYQDLPAIGDGTLISALNYDLQGQTGSVLNYLTTGTSPNQVLTIEWVGYRAFTGGGSTGDNFNFQIKLYETSNIIEIIYGPFTYGAFTHESWEVNARVGLYGTTNGDYFLRTHATDWTTTNNGTSNGDNIVFNGTTLPTNGLTFRYTPISYLPIELVSFVGYPIDKFNEIEWSVASQINNDRFIIEKSKNAIDWEFLTQIKGSGSISVLLNYKCIDTNPYFITYYRLTQTDYDGHTEAYNVITVINHNTTETIKLRPNPSKSFIIIEIPLGEDVCYTIEITNIDGESLINKLFDGNKGMNSYYLDTTPLPTGIYLIKINSKNISYSNFFIKE